LITKNLSGSGKRTGMTLVEVLIGLVILTLGIGGAVNLYAKQVKRVGITRHRLASSMLARGELARFENRGFVSIQSEYFSEADTATSATVQGLSNNGATWWKATLTYRPDVSPAPRIDVRVQSGQGARVPESVMKSQMQEVVGYVVSQ